MKEKFKERPKGKYILDKEELEGLVRKFKDKPLIESCLAKSKYHPGILIYKSNLVN